MSYWIREIAGWLLIGLGLLLFVVVFEFCERSAHFRSIDPHGGRRGDVSEEASTYSKSRLPRRSANKRKIVSIRHAPAGVGPRPNAPAVVRRRADQP